MSKLLLWAALCPEGQEHDTAYRLLAEASRKVWGLSPLPEICHAPGGKPFFQDHPQLQFNLSHSHGAVVCGLHDLPLGVDVEKLREPPERLGRGMDAPDFFHLWTGREATVKRQGLGVAALLRAPEPDPLCRWETELLPGYVICVCPSVETEICTRSGSLSL